MILINTFLMFLKYQAFLFICCILRIFCIYDIFVLKRPWAPGSQGDPIGKSREAPKALENPREPQGVWGSSLGSPGEPQ